MLLGAACVAAVCCVGLSLRICLTARIVSAMDVMSQIDPIDRSRFDMSPWVLWPKMRFGK